MTTVLGNKSKFKIDSKDLSAYINNTDVKQSADSLDATTYGSDGHVYAGGLTDGTISIAGTYDNTADVNPSAVLRPLLGTVVTFEWDPEGSASGSPMITGNVLVTGYDESSPVADLIKWAADLQISGDVTTGSVT